MLTFVRALTLSDLGLAALLIGGFIALLFLGSLALPGRHHCGVLLPDGTRKSYKLNGLTLFVVLAVVVAAGMRLGLFSLASLYHHFWSLLVVANAFAFAFATVLFVTGRARGPRGGVWHDWYYGTEVSPTRLGLDLKMFSYRPSLMGLGLLNGSFAAAQWQVYGYISTPMLLYEVFYLLYLANYFQFEYGMLYTWDIVAERFGWMLIWGDYVLVPFFYSLPGWFLVDRVTPLPPGEIAGLVALYAFGFWLFRGANEQKHRYKVDPHARIWGRPARALGGRLLISGFWGIGRKLNYTGELCLYYAWTLPCGFNSLIPYLLPLWLTCFFPHRAWRDEKRCREKYGPLWAAYCRRARFRMLPFIY